MNTKLIPAALIAAIMMATPAMAECNTGASIRAKHRAPVLNGKNSSWDARGAVLTYPI